MKGDPAPDRNPPSHPSSPRAEALLVAAVTGFILLPFLGKPFHMDDPLFLWAARQIRAHPLDPYGFDVNWYGWRLPMWEVTKNPPGASYFIALASLLGGWSEVALHLAFLLPAIAAAIGIYSLSRQLCARPLLAAMIAVLSPAFVVSSTNVMCDTLLLAFWVWAVVLWRDGLKEDRWTRLLGAAALVALAAFSKYYGVALVPLLLAYGLMYRRRPGTWILALVLPLVAFLLYDWGTSLRYGHRLLSEAVVYSNAARGVPGTTGGLFGRGLVTLSFAGGCFASALLFGPLLWRGRARLGWIMGGLALVAGLRLAGGIGATRLDAPGVRWLLLLQLSLFILGGLHILALVIADVREARDADSMLLGLWVLGTFVFAAYANWAINVRSLLPMVPAVGILVVRRLQRRHGDPRTAIGVLLGVAGALAMGVATADFSFADTARTAAEVARRELAGTPGGVWFEGHWGFQYYMEAGGARPLERYSTRLVTGDRVVIPEENTNLFLLPDGVVSNARLLVRRPLPWLAATDFSLGAGFYTDLCGPLPFSFGTVSPMRHVIVTIGQDTQLH